MRHNNGYVIELEHWEDFHGTDAIEYFPEHEGYFPYWLKYVDDKKAVLEYVAEHRGDWLEETIKKEV